MFCFHFETMIINCQIWNIFQINVFENFNQSSYFLPQEVLGYFSNDEMLTEKPQTNSGKILNISSAITCNELMLPIGSPVHSGNTFELCMFPLFLIHSVHALCLLLHPRALNSNVALIKIFFCLSRKITDLHSCNSTQFSCLYNPFP